LLPPLRAGSRESDFVLDLELVNDIDNSHRQQQFGLQRKTTAGYP
jgi:hypothetical protein